MRIVFILVLSMALLLFGCDDNASDPVVTPPASLGLSPSQSSLAAGADAEQSLRLEGLTTPVFGVSVQLSFNNSVVTFGDSLTLVEDGFFGTSAIGFARSEGSTLHLTVTRTQGSDPVSGSGVVGTLHVHGLAAGSSTMTILPDDLHFYDADGNVIAVPDLELATAVIEVH